jgi:hypothetical protein
MAHQVIRDALYRCMHDQMISRALYRCIIGALHCGHTAERCDHSMAHCRWRRWLQPSATTVWGSSSDACPKIPSVIILTPSVVVYKVCWIVFSWIFVRDCESNRDINADDIYAPLLLKKNRVLREKKIERQVRLIKIIAEIKANRAAWFWNENDSKPKYFITSLTRSPGCCDLIPLTANAPKIPKIAMASKSNNAIEICIKTTTNTFFWSLAFSTLVDLPMTEFAHFSEMYLIWLFY